MSRTEKKIIYKPLTCCCLVSALILTSIVGVFASASTTVPEQTGYVVTRQPVHDLKSLFAAVQTVDVTQARARIGGTLVELLVDEGDVVTAGQRLARVRDSKQNLQIAALASKLRSLDAQLQLANITFERVNKLYKTGKMSESRLDEAQTQVDVVTAEISALRGEQAVIRESQIEGDVLVPASGRVLQVPVTQGSVVLPGEVIAEIAAESYILRLLLPERHARFINVGDIVLVGNRGMLDEGFATGADAQRKGEISQVYPELDNGRVVADVVVDGLGDFFVGERVRVWVATDERLAYIVPAQYLHRRYGLSYVYLANGTEVVVQPGLELESGVEVLSGLRDGDVLVTEVSTSARQAESEGKAEE